LEAPDPSLPAQGGPDGVLEILNRELS